MGVIEAPTETPSLAHSLPTPQLCDVRFGSKANKSSQAKIHRCPLLSKSGQNVAMPRLSAKCHKRTNAGATGLSALCHKQTFGIGSDQNKTPGHCPGLYIVSRNST
jgi:hypothetical protein